ncbi:T9SS type A sorting domain-containing protein [Pedobacter alpinus]|uniref:T9SS type A sorting domain-containing protein n=1 Tax=Pedobacter alpinus TaxID=1590643 RepID=A0ABW5TR51_9SPHI
MKKLLLLTFVSLISFTAYGQNSTKNWEKLAGNAEPSFSWFTTTGANVNSCAYNPITDKLYVSNRQVGIYIINPATGAITGNLNITGITLAGSLAFHKIRVTPTGEIFAASLRTSTANGNTFVYYWASESAVPVLIGNATTGISLLSERSADAFALTGSGNNVVMYFGGSGTSNLQVVNKNGTGITNFVKINNIALTVSGSARSSIAPVTTGITSSVWISGAAAQKKLITSTGTVTKALADNVLSSTGSYTSLNSISNKFASLEYFEIDSKQFLVATGANDSPTSTGGTTGEGLILHIYDVTDVNNVKLVETTKLSNTYNANTTPGTDVTIKKVLNVDGTYTVTFFQLINHNGLASYTLNFKADGTLPVSLTSFAAAFTNNQNSLTWATSSESNSAGFDIESSIDGLAFNKIGFVASKGVNGSSSVNLNYFYEDKTATSGTTYYRLKQIDKDGKFEYSEIKFVKNLLLENQNSFKIYPNPTTDYVEITGKNQEEVTVQLFTSFGKEVKAELVNGRINMSALDAGIYVLRISKEGKVLQSNKIVKQ